MRRKKLQKTVDRELLNSIIVVETEWKKLRHIIDNGIEPMLETRQKLLLVEARYTFLIKEAKRRKISILPY